DAAARLGASCRPPVRLSLGHAHRGRHAAMAGPRRRTLSQAAVRVRVDRAPRFPGTPGPHLSGCVGAGRARQAAAMSRARILGRIAAALDQAGGMTARRGAVAERLAYPPAHPLPERAQGDAPAKVERFKVCLGAVGVDVLEAAAASEAPEVIAAYLSA